MIFRNLIFEPEVVKQRLRAGMVSHHEQQASKWNGEQQHRVLWPAYNPNIAPPQASTEGLFQQTRLISTVILHYFRNAAIFFRHEDFIRAKHMGKESVGSRSFRTFRSRWVLAS